MSVIPPHRDFIILRDMNLCLLRECCLLRKYLALSNNNMLTKLMCKPTRITDKTPTILFDIIVSREERLTQGGSIPIGFSDYDFCSRKTNYKLKLKSRKYPAIHTNYS